MNIVLMFSHVWLFKTPWTVGHLPPLSMEFFQASTGEQVAISSSRGSSRPRGSFWTQESNLRLLCFLHEQAYSLPLVSPGKLFLDFQINSIDLYPFLSISPCTGIQGYSFLSRTLIKFSHLLKTNKTETASTFHCLQFKLVRLHFKALSDLASTCFSRFISRSSSSPMLCCSQSRHLDVSLTHHEWFYFLNCPYSVLFYLFLISWLQPFFKMPPHS